jgi:penicillin-binding protein 2
MMVALAALEEGLIEPDEIIVCKGFIEVGNRRFHDWKRGGHGKVDLIKSLQQSCDVYYYEIAQRVGIEKITAMARRFGLGQRFSLPLSAVAAGLTPTKAWKKRNRGESWLIGDTLNSGIGQGFVLASPLQLSVMTARLASGRMVEPRIVKTINGVETASSTGAPLGVSPENLDLVRQGMFAVSNTRRGTAYRSRIEAEGYFLAGKTGTSQVRGITMAQRAAGLAKSKDVPWEERDHALFVAYAPADQPPKIAVSVVVEHGGGGSTAAAPVARDIILQALYDGLPPLSAYPAAQRRSIEAMRENLNLREETTARQGRIKT